jgi:hypothetical protein
MSRSLPKKFKRIMGFVLMLSVLYTFFYFKSLEDEQFRMVRSSVLGQMITICGAEETFKNIYARVGTVEELGRENLIDEKLLSGNYHGYNLTIVAKGESFAVSAVPVKYGRGFPYNHTGVESFYMYIKDDKNFIHAVDKQGLSANESDPELIPRKPSSR